MDKLICLAAAPLLLAACATPNSGILADASAVTGASEEALETDDSTVDGDREICKRRIITGSRFPKRVCLTWDQWREIEYNSKQLGREIQRIGGHSNPHDPRLGSEAFTGKH